MAQLYVAVAAESKKPGKAFHELVRRRRRELGLSVPQEERVLPFRPRPSASLPAIDVVIDREAEDPGDEHILDLMRTERRLEELEIALQNVHPRSSYVRAMRELEDAYTHELRRCDALVERVE
jgi:hypothetical protein